MVPAGYSSGIEVAGDSLQRAIPSPAVPETTVTDHNGVREEMASAADGSVVGNPTQLLDAETLILSENLNNQNLSSDDGSSSGERNFQSSWSSAIVVGNNQDLMTQVLLFLPAKSLMRFQCVSKDWLSIISSSNFRLLHSRKNPGAEVGLLMLRKIQGKSKLYHVPLCKEELNSVGMISSRFSNLFDVEGEIVGMHSSKGLFCIDFLPANESRRFYVFNPTTNQCRRIPLVDTMDWSKFEIVAVNICFDPLESEYYSLVCVWEKKPGVEGRQKFRYTVYSSENGVWKNCERSNAPGWRYSFHDGVFWNGIQFWCNEMDVLYYDFKHDYGQQVWDDGHEETGPGYVLYFGESGGNIWLIYSTGYELEISQLEVDIYPNASHFAQWLPKYHIDLGFLCAFGPLLVKPPNPPKCIFDVDFGFRMLGKFGFRVRSFVVDERGQNPRLVISVPGKIICYDIKGKTVEELVQIEPADLNMFELNLTSFTFNGANKLVETLACV
ncbi:F-box protein At5g07610-like [Coffea eugenioides]|uniref:F-box protein At5g07610-like n=1 Tax=Coffea eugenioides TaxID=49369 RepID=UPI000F605454|nr:F-box protein At5g07610-like [Coffea eugenioides]